MSIRNEIDGAIYATVPFIKNFRPGILVLSCGYCDLQNIAFNQNRRFVNSGIYGWNWDCYYNWFENVAILTGYRNLNAPRISNDVIEKFDKIALDIKREYRENEIDYNEFAKKMSSNYIDFIRAAVAEYIERGRK